MRYAVAIVLLFLGLLWFSSGLYYLLTWTKLANAAIGLTTGGAALIGGTAILVCSRRIGNIVGSLCSLSLLTFFAVFTAICTVQTTIIGGREVHMLPLIPLLLGVLSLSVLGLLLWDLHCLTRVARRKANEHARGSKLSDDVTGEGKDYATEEEENP